MESRVILSGVDHYRVMEAMFEGLRVILSYRGEPYSPAYIQGLSGAAFRVSGPCPCAPTCGQAMEPQALVRLLGYETEYLPLCEDGMDPAVQVAAVVTRVKDELRAGRPALVWHAFTYAEWDVVCGYDDAQGLFYGRGSYMGRDDYASADQKRTSTCLDICPALGAILIGQKSGAFDARAAELAALQEAVHHARTPDDRFSPEMWNTPVEWRFRNGLGCYDWWINSFRISPPKVANMGDRYCLGVFQSTHRAAADFCQELALKYPAAGSALTQAAEHFGAEADALHVCAELLFPGWELPQAADPECNARVADLLTQAQGSYARGIDAIENVLQVIH